uniref:protein 4.1-like isoform X4 n=1 Tax=Solea senegalensis TaxID=28829 RepID=UPI001CD8C945|nr:protein 4.1-like isoform X4 [Solea senegalensis]
MTSSPRSAWCRRHFDDVDFSVHHQEEEGECPHEDRWITMTTEPGEPQEAQHKEAESFTEATAHSTPKQSEEGGANQIHGSLAEDSTSHLSSNVTRSPARGTINFWTMNTRVTLLDGSTFTCTLEKRARGLQLFEKVCEHVNLLERDYFSLSFRDTDDNKNWLDPAKDIKKQVRGVPWNFSFNVKFYPPDPAQLSEDLTRYFLCLQLRQDIISGRLPCSFATHTVLGSYTVQSELGDYDQDECGSNYISELSFAPNQSKEMEEKIMELHRNYRGMSPAEAELHFLENVKKLSMYGVDLHHAKDSEGVAIMLGICSSGLLIYRDRLRINRFSWPKILKISYKRNNFYVKIRPGEFDQFESTIGFKLFNHRAAKRLWKVCVEHHSFFRLVSPEEPPKKFLSLGSKFRYSGRTQIQSRRASAQISRPAPHFTRCVSKRNLMSRSLDGGQMTTPTPSLIGSPVITANGSPHTDMGVGLYAASKSVGGSDLMTSGSPERKTEKTRGAQQEVIETAMEAEQEVIETAMEAEQEVIETAMEAEQEGIEEDETLTRVMEVSQQSPPTHKQDTKTELTDTAMDGDLTATESDQDEDLKTQEAPDSPEDVQNPRHQDISALRRSFLEGGQTGGGQTEWERRLAASPLRRADDSPMIEPLEPDEEGGVKINQAPPQRIREKCHTVGRSYDTTSGKIVSVTSRDTSFDVTMTMSLEVGRQAPPIPPSTDDDITGRTLMTICEVKTPVSPLEPPRGICAAISETEGGGGASVMSPLTLCPNSSQAAVAEAMFEEISPELKTLLRSAREQETLLKNSENSETGFLMTESRDHDRPLVDQHQSWVGVDSDHVTGFLLSSQTFTSETANTSTTTHITKTVKGGISETRVEKRIVISGDTDVDQDQALAAALSEAKREHPELCVTRVVVHKETCDSLVSPQD